MSKANKFIAKKRGQQALRNTFAFTRMVLLLAFLSLGLVYLAVKSLDGHIENQDRMLCESALISKNEEWLEKCRCFYAKGNIKCLQE